MRGKVAKRIRRMAEGVTTELPLVKYRTDYHKKILMRPGLNGKSEPVEIQLANVRMVKCTRKKVKSLKRFYKDLAKQGTRRRAA